MRGAVTLRRVAGHAGGVSSMLRDQRALSLSEAAAARRRSHDARPFRLRDDRSIADVVRRAHEERRPPVGRRGTSGRRPIHVARQTNAVPHRDHDVARDAGGGGRAQSARQRAQDVTTAVHPTAFNVMSIALISSEKVGRITRCRRDVESARTRQERTRC